MFTARIEELKRLIQNCKYTTYVDDLDETRALRFLHSQLLKVKDQSRAVYVIGNGGSAGIASHFCIDLLNIIQLRASTLYDTNVMTCMSNDYGYEEIFSRPLQTYLQKDDLLVAISSSGSSKNILNAVHVAKEKKANVITLSGFSSTNPLRALGDINLWVNAQDYGLVESAHFFLLHTIVDSWEIDFLSLEATKLSNANAK